MALWLPVILAFFIWAIIMKSLFFCQYSRSILATSILILIGYLIGLLQLIQGLFMISCEILFFISRFILKLFKKLFKPNQEKPKSTEEILSNNTKSS